MTPKALLTFSIFLLLTLVRLATEKEIPLVNHSPSFFLKVNYAEPIYVSVISHEVWTLIDSFSFIVWSVNAKFEPDRDKAVRLVPNFVYSFLGI